LPIQRLKLYGLAAGLAVSAGVGAQTAAQTTIGADTGNADTDRLVQLSKTANAALLKGKIDAYLDDIPVASDFTLMSPLGGDPSRGFDTSEKGREAMRKFFRSSSRFDQELVATYASEDLIVLVTIERMQAQIADTPEQDWSLRVTQVYRRNGGTWELAHRHADPLAHAVGVAGAAALARGRR
jgi:ketosteroid isomerase-like protein